MQELLLKGLALAGFELAEAARILGVPVEKIEGDYLRILSAPIAEKLEIIYSEPIEQNKKFLKLCFHGKKKFVYHFLGLSNLSPKEITELLMKVETDPALIARLGKLLLEYEKLELKKKEEREEVEELMDLLRAIRDSLESS